MKFYGQFDPPQDQVIYERYFKDFSGKGVCLECGATDGETISSTKFFEETLGWQAINIEPHPKMFKCLVNNRPKSININIALSDKSGYAYLFTKRKLYFRSHLVSQNQRNTVPIKSLTYKELIATIPIDHIDLMVLDVEGHEMEVLNGMRNAKILPHILCVEFNITGRETIQPIVSEMGYKFDFTLAINDIYKLEAA